MGNKCISCGMPMTNNKDHAMDDASLNYCHHCARPDGSMKSRTEVLDGMTAFLVRTQGIDEAVAKNMADQAMAQLPAWKTK